MPDHITLATSNTEIRTFEIPVISILREVLSHVIAFSEGMFKNRAPTSCRLGPILSTISFELHTKMANKTGLEKCNFEHFRRSVTLTLTLDRVEITLVRISGRRGSHTKLDRNWKNFLWTFTDGQTHLSSVSLLAHHWAMP